MSGNAVLSVANVDTFGPGTLSNFSNVIIFKPDSGVRLEDLLLELIQSPIALNSIGEQAKDYAQKNFSWHENADKHIDLYSSLKMVNKK